VNRRIFIGVPVKTVGAVLVAGSLPAVLSKPHYSTVVTPFFIGIMKGREERGEMLGPWNADQHLQHLADFIHDNPETRGGWRQMGLAL
jgi:hypothetical protein